MAWVYVIGVQASWPIVEIDVRTALPWRAVIEKCAPWRSAAAVVAWA